jgi:GGDEF domain-containing protein
MTLQNFDVLASALVDEINNSSRVMVQEEIIFSSVEPTLEILSLIECLNKKLGESFTKLSLSTKLVVLGMTETFSRKVISDRILDEVLCRLDFISNITHCIGRTIGEKMIKALPLDSFKLILLDVSNLKGYNDFGTRGLASGDAALFSVAESLQIYLEANHTGSFVIHWGGDEFMIVYPVEEMVNVIDIENYVSSNVDTSKFVDVCNIKMIELYLKYHEIDKKIAFLFNFIEGKKREFLANENLCLRLDNNLLELRESDMKRIYSSPEVIDLIREIIPQPIIKIFCGESLVVNSRCTNNEINQSLSKERNVNYKKGLWVNPNTILWAIFADPRQDGRKRRVND